MLALIGLCEVATRREDVPEPRLVRNASRIHLGAGGGVCEIVGKRGLLTILLCCLVAEERRVSEVQVRWWAFKSITNYHMHERESTTTSSVLKRIVAMSCESRRHHVKVRGK